MLFTIQVYKVENKPLVNRDVSSKYEQPKRALRWYATYSTQTGKELLELLWSYDISYKDINRFEPSMEYNYYLNPKNELHYNFWNGVHRPIWDESRYFAIIFGQNGLAINPYSLNLKQSYYILNGFNDRLSFSLKAIKCRRCCYKEFRHTKHWNMIGKYPEVSQVEIEESAYQGDCYISIPKIKHARNRRGFNSWDYHCDKRSEKGNCWKTKKIRKQYQKNSEHPNIRLLNRIYKDHTECDETNWNEDFDIKDIFK